MIHIAKGNVRDSKTTMSKCGERVAMENIGSVYGFDAEKITCVKCAKLFLDGIKHIADNWTDIFGCNVFDVLNRLIEKKGKMKTKKFYNTAIEINALLIGSLWMSPDEVDVERAITFYRKPQTPYQKRFNDLYDAFRTIQTDGDFEDLSFAESVGVTVILEVTKVNTETSQIVENKRKYRFFTITKDNPEYAKFFA